MRDGYIDACNHCRSSVWVEVEFLSCMPITSLSSNGRTAGFGPANVGSSPTGEIAEWASGKAASKH